MTALIQFKFGMLIYNIKTQVKFDLGYNPVMGLFSSSEHKVLRVSYFDGPLSVVVRRASSFVRKLFYLNIFSSETTHWIWTKLHRNYPCVVPYQSCSNGSDWLHK